MQAHGTLFCRKGKWKERECYVLGNGLIRLVTLMGGGHIAELRFDNSTGFPVTNPLWVPPWKTIEPYRYRTDEHGAKYGPLSEGKLLSGLAGHNVCLDYFGSPSVEETRRGFSQHGEAPNSRWSKVNDSVTSSETNLTVSVNLTRTGLSLTRQIKLRSGEPVVYFTEKIENKGDRDHFFHWVQHVTLGPPFLSHRDSTIALPGTVGLTFPYEYDEGKSVLISRRRFRWPSAPTKSGNNLNLRRPFWRKGFGFVAGVLLDKRREMGFVAAMNSREHVLIAYCFPRRFFPWVAIWEENHAIAAVPWCRRTKAVGLEFGTTPIPVSRRENFINGGPLFGTPTITYVPSRGSRVVRYLGLLVEVPTEFKDVGDIQMRDAKLMISNLARTKHVRLDIPDLMDHVSAE